MYSFSCLTCVHIFLLVVVWLRGNNLQFSSRSGSISLYVVIFNSKKLCLLIIFCSTMFFFIICVVFNVLKYGYCIFLILIFQISKWAMCSWRFFPLHEMICIYCNIQVRIFVIMRHARVIYFIGYSLLLHTKHLPGLNSINFYY